jgi:hypothetical protein
MLAIGIARKYTLAMTLTPRQEHRKAWQIAEYKNVSREMLISTAKAAAWALPPSTKGFLTELTGFINDNDDMVIDLGRVTDVYDRNPDYPNRSQQYLLNLEIAGLVETTEDGAPVLNRLGQQTVAAVVQGQ